MNDLAKGANSRARGARCRSVLCRGLVCALSLAIGALPSAQGEGTAELGSSQGLSSTTTLHVDVLAAGETITWQGGGEATLRDPDGAQVAVLSSGQGYATLRVGTFAIELDADQASVWDVGLDDGGGAVSGRLWSPRWTVMADGYGPSSATEASLYALVPGGTAEQTAVVEVRFDGLAGFAYEVAASTTGADPRRAGRSVASSDAALPPGLPLYLNPPAAATNATLIPSIADPRYLDESNVFTFESNTEGTSHLICDLNADEIFDPTSGADRLVVSEALPGLNVARWDGHDNSGGAVPAGNYSCVLELHVGETHFILFDVETSFEGLRLFVVDGSLERTGLPMFWNDFEVQDAAIAMPNADLSPENSGPFGLDSGAYGDAAAPQGQTLAGNARAWGAFSISGGKGDGTAMDTFCWLAKDTSAEIAVAFDPAFLFADGFELGNTVLWTYSVDGSS